MRERIRAFSWETHALGSLETWPDELRNAASLCLGMGFPCCVFWGPDGIQIYNDGYANVMRRKHPEGLGQTLFDTWPEANRELRAMLTAIFEGQAIFQEDHPWVLDREGDLQSYTFTSSMAPIFGRRGEVLGVFHTVIESTDSVTARRLERANELTALFESMPDAVYIGNLEGITHCNQNALRMLGVSSLDALQANIGELGKRFAVRSIATGKLIPANELSFVRALTTGKTVVEDVMATRADTGEPVYIRGASAPIWDKGQLIGAVAINTDVTDRYLANEALDRSERRFRTLIAASSDAMFRLSCDGSDMQYLQALAPGATEDHPPASHPHWIAEYVHPEDQDRVSAVVQEAVRARRPFEVEHRTRETDGTARWLCSRAVPLLGKNGEILDWFGMTSNVTERKLSEATLLQNEKLAAVGRLAASIAHEINNPLESVTNLLYLARNGQTVSEIQEYLETAERELRRVSVITSQTLRFYKQPTSPRAVTCDDLFGGVLSTHQGRFVNSNIVVEKRKRASKGIECFDGEIRQVLNNLISNAIDALHPLGGRLIVRSREACNWTTGVKGLALTVADNGMGIPPAVIKKVFDAFFTTKGLGGTGLGLWLSKEIVHRHHGTLRVRSAQRPNRSGTVFVLFLPFDAVRR